MTTSAQPSARSSRGLDWLNFFVADVRTGVGPFVAVYLANNHWNVAQIGLALTAAELAGVVTQAPGGAITDHLRSKRMLLAIAIVVLAASALLLALYPNIPVVMGAQIALGMTGSLFGPGISAITLGLVSYHCLGARTGRNAAFGSAGNVVAALTMGYIGYHFTTRAIFFFVAVLAIPTLMSLAAIRSDEIDYERARGGGSREEQRVSVWKGLRSIFCDHRMIIFVTLTILWHLGNGAMLAGVGEMIAHDRPKESSLWMSAAVTVPQVIMMLIGPPVGKIADARGRKPILLFGFAFLPLRALLFAYTTNPYLLMTYQIFDGISAGIFGIVGVLMIADMTRGTGHYNLALGTVGAAVGVGASISTTMAGFIAQRYGFGPSFLALGASALAAFLVLWLLMPETLNANEGEEGESWTDRQVPAIHANTPHPVVPAPRESARKV